MNNPDGVTDNTVVEIPKGHIEFGTDPFDFNVLLKKPMTDRYIDAAAKGRLDLAGITQFVKLDGNTKLAGTVDADVQAKGNLAVVQQQKPGEFYAKRLHRYQQAVLRFERFSATHSEHQRPNKFLKVPMDWPTMP